MATKKTNGNGSKTTTTKENGGQKTMTHKMVKKNIPIDLIDDNPFRNKSIYPVAQSRVDELKQSIIELELITPFTVREVDGRYQLPYAHHRLEACKQLGYETVPAVVTSYTDSEMLRVMTVENAFQRLPEQAVADSVAGIISRLAVIALKSSNLDEFNAYMSMEIGSDLFYSTEKDFTNLRNAVSNGKKIGADSIQRYLPEGTYSVNAIQSANDTLLATGNYKSIIENTFEQLKNDDDFIKSQKTFAEQMEKAKETVESLKAEVKDTVKKFKTVSKELAKKKMQTAKETDAAKKEVLADEIKALTKKRNDLILDQQNKKDQIQAKTFQAKQAEKEKSTDIDTIAENAIKKAAEVKPTVSNDAVGLLVKEDWLRSFKGVMKSERAQEAWPLNTQKELVETMLHDLEQPIDDKPMKPTGARIRAYLNDMLDAIAPIERNKTELATMEVKEAIAKLKTLNKIRRAFRQVVEHGDVGFMALAEFDYKKVISEMQIIRDNETTVLGMLERLTEKANKKVEADKAAKEAAKKAKTKEAAKKAKETK
jgi:hypothetical protein